MLRRSTALVTVLAAAGVGLLGASVQGIAAVDDDLRAAVREHRVLERQDDGVKRDCPKPRRSTKQSTSTLRY